MFSCMIDKIENYIRINLPCEFIVDFALHNNLDKCIYMFIVSTSNEG